MYIGNKSTLLPEYYYYVLLEYKNYYQVYKESWLTHNYANCTFKEVSPPSHSHNLVF